MREGGSVNVVNKISVQVSHDYPISEMGEAVTFLEDLVVQIHSEVLGISEDFSGVLRDSCTGEKAKAVERTSSAGLVRAIYRHASSLEESLKELQRIRERNTLK